ncbi:hypothetical protein SynBMKMC1_02408 [Synechococcus sp. BMK-MC-1]|nr:hypothetical protein SynBMKMC1_02408 [Synechococcus sp. BMK-MC-1]
MLSSTEAGLSAAHLQARFGFPFRLRGKNQACASAGGR